MMPSDHRLAGSSLTEPAAPAAHAVPDRAARRGPMPLPATEKREHCVSVRLNAAELMQLDLRRGRFQRGEWLRMAAIDQLPPSIPALNAHAWAELARLSKTLKQGQVPTNFGSPSQGENFAQLEHLRREVVNLRHALVGTRP